MFMRYAFTSLLSLLMCSAGFDVRAHQPRTAWDPPLETRAVLMVAVDPGEGGGSIELSPNEYVGLVVMPGFRSTDDLCASSVQVGLSAANLDEAAAAWHVEARLVELRQGEATIDLRWTRRIKRADIMPSDAVTSERRVVLRQGDSRILDVVRTTRKPVPECDSFGVTYELQFLGPPELSNAAIAYDLWLVQQDADGELVTDRYRVTARQGQQVDYFFRPVPYAADGRRAARDPAVLMDVHGAIRGRVRTDGNIDLTVDGARWFRAPDASSAVGSEGRTLLTVKPGETVEVANELPVNGRWKNALGGNRTAVRITTKRLW